MNRKKSGKFPSEGSAQKSARPGHYSYVQAAAPEVELSLTAKRKVNIADGLKTAAFTAGLVLAAAATIYSGITYYYTSHFVPGTRINGISASNKTAYEVELALAARLSNYTIDVVTRNLETESISAEDINYEYSSSGEVLDILKNQNPFLWIQGFSEGKSYVIQENATYDKALLEEQVLSLEAAKEENQYPAADAYISYQNETFVIVPETEGTQIILREAYHALESAIDSGERTIDLGMEDGVYEEAAVTSQSPELIETCTAYNNMANASISYQFGEETVTLDAATIKSWLQFDDRGQLLQNDVTFQQKAAEFVASLAATYDTVNTSRPFTATTGREVYVYGSAYGWQIDQAAETAQLISDIQNGAVTTREPIYSKTANSHGYNDFGDTYIEVDMTDQYMYYYRDGVVILESPIVSGLISDPERATPEGVYTLYYKKSPDVLRGEKDEEGEYEYEQPVSFWMPFNGGVGFHDATWQDYFGGDRYTYAGSHGCINLPYYAAASLYELIDYNVPIICFYY